MKSTVKNTSIISGILLNLTMIILLAIFIILGHETANKNASVQEDTYRTHFQSRLILKSINALNLARFNLQTSLKDMNKSKLWDAEDSFLASYSNYHILLSEQVQNKSHLSNRYFDAFEKLSPKYENVSEGKRADIEDLILSTTNLIDSLFKEESYLWVEESMKFHRFSQIKKRNREVFYALTAFFILVQLGLIYFTVVRYRLQKKINQQHDQLVLQTRLSTLGMMGAELAHEINSPLMVIDGRLKIVQNDTMNAEIDRAKLTKNLEVIKRNSARIQSIIKNFKTLSKSGINDPFERVTIDEIYSEVDELIHERAKQESVNLIYKAEEENLELDVRRIQIVQVLTNLVNNSIEAIKESEEKWVTVKAWQDPETIYITVTDSGRGIPFHLREHIFEPFYSTKNSSEGTGLGLSISKKIMKEHNGDLIYVQESPFTEFKLSFKKKAR